MKVSCFIFLMSCYTITAAQSFPDFETTYLVFDYMKVKPGNQEDYLFLESAWKKIHQARLNNGLIDGWSFYKVMSPKGTDAEYNYVVANVLRGEDKLADYYEKDFYPTGWKSLLTKKELQLHAETEEVRTLVKSEVWYFVDGVFAENWFEESSVFVYNYMKIKQGRSLAEHSQIERSIWKPVHDAKIKAKQATGWGVYNMMLPFGAYREYQCATLDVYKDMRQFLNSEYIRFFEESHPDKDINTLLSQTSEVVNIKYGQVWLKVDGINK